MDRDKFIKEFGKASVHLDEDRACDIMLNCIRRQREKYGKLSDTIIPVAVMEECAELSEAISHKIRGREEDDYELLQEMADVLIDILALAIMHDIPKDDVIKAVNVKLDREAERIRQHDEDRKMLSQL